METISNLWHGRVSLARAYWLWGIVGGALWGIPLALVTPGSAPAIVAVFAFMAYYVVVNTGIWRSASAYTGPKVWAILAHVGAALGFITIAVMVLAIVAGGLSALRGQPTDARSPSAPAAQSSSDDGPWKQYQQPPTR